MCGHDGGMRLIAIAGLLLAIAILVL